MVAFPYAGEARAVVSFVTQLLAHGAQLESVAVISFYAKQCTLLRQLLPVTDPPVGSRLSMPPKAVNGTLF